MSNAPYIKYLKPKYIRNYIYVRNSKLLKFLILFHIIAHRVPETLHFLYFALNMFLSQ